MALIVQKFGGSSVADVQRIQNVANIIAKTQSDGHDVVVVVSARYGETDRLIQLAKQFSSDSQSEYDALLATGEQASAALLSMALQSCQCRARSFNGQQVKIVTTGTHKKARIIDVECEALKQELQQGGIPIVAGFQGVTRSGRVTTLGRGGSDLTAVAIAAALKADECQIFSDVDGVYTSDPKIVPEASRISRITFEEMMELASLGAKVLQNRCLEFAGKHEVPLRVLSSLEAGDGTLIDYNQKHSENPVIRGVAFDRQQAQITFQGISQRPGLLSYILSPIHLANIEVDMIVQSAPSAEGKVDMTFTLNQNDFSAAYAIATKVAPELEACGLIGDDDVAKLSLVGVGLRSHASVASKMLSALGQEGIDIALLTATEIKISAIIKASRLDLGARALHQAFALGQDQQGLPAI